MTISLYSYGFTLIKRSGIELVASLGFYNFIVLRRYQTTIRGYRKSAFHLLGTESNEAKGRRYD